MELDKFIEDVKKLEEQVASLTKENQELTDENEKLVSDSETNKKVLKAIGQLVSKAVIKED